MLRSLGFAKPLVAEMVQLALRHGTGVEAELLASNQVSEEAYYAAIARMLRLPFLENIDPACVADIDSIDSQLTRPLQIRVSHRDRAPQVAIIPEAQRLPEIIAALERLPGLGAGLAVTTPSIVRRAVWAAGARRRVRATVSSLFDSYPDHSARIVTTGRQGFVGGLLVSLMMLAIFLATDSLLPSAHVVLSTLYLLSLLLRVGALIHHTHRKITLSPEPEGQVPFYTVMVALYREASMVPQLVASLERLEWPRSRLEVKLVCEGDDRETLAALQAIALPPHFEVIEVPPFHPRTKPKALTYALTSVRGEFVAVYDAEDRPHPRQLVEAYRRFRIEGPELACLQAPLIIANLRDSFISALFAIEYAALFRGLLPMLGRYRMPMPLGGTSNHFRTDVLKKVGGWDPFNVTEDADLGLRLYRLGFRADTLRHQTLEDAPVDLPVWIGQRIRWFKGWLQTWLVMTRTPFGLLKQIGWRASLIFHLLIGGMLVSALLHPLILVFAISAALQMMNLPGAHVPVFDLCLFIVDVTNILGSYATFLALGVGSMIDHEKRRVGWRWACVPVYWFLTSYAAWRALNELRTNPFFWKKTPHKPSKR